MATATTETFTDERVSQVLPGLQKLFESRDGRDLEIVSKEQRPIFAHKVILEIRMPALGENIETDKTTGKLTLNLSNFMHRYVDK